MVDDALVETNTLSQNTHPTSRPNMHRDFSTSVSRDIATCSNTEEVGRFRDRSGIPTVDAHD